MVAAGLKGKAAISKPNDLEKLFSVVPRDQGSSNPPDNTCPVVTILSIVRDGESWGVEGRSFQDFLAVGPRF